MPLIYGEGRDNAFRRLRRVVQEFLEDPLASLGDDITSRTLQDTHNASPLLRGHKTIVPLSRERNTSYEMFLEDLAYHRMNERRFQIRAAQKGTYEWLLDPQARDVPWTQNMRQWLSADKATKRIYWISGKPASGKSTVIRLLDQEIDPNVHLRVWTRDRALLKVHHYFWNPGSALQSSAVGMLRNMLCQVLRKKPDLIRQVVLNSSWMGTRITQDFDWSQGELQSLLLDCLSALQDSHAVLLLVDGLDEVTGTEQARIELNDYLLSLAEMPHVKMCVSSRPWNIFRDAFTGFPNLRLEDLTRNDIYVFVVAHLSEHPQFQEISKYDRATADDIVHQICQKASGVFLWVRLVVRELLTALRNGAGLRTLRKALHSIPPDLNAYFKRIMDSIPREKQYEASVMLQTALYHEEDFASTQSIRLLDFAFTEEDQASFVIPNRYDQTVIQLPHRQALRYRLESTLRRLDSNCRGLLECHYDRTSDVFADSAILLAERQVTSLNEIAFGEHQIDQAPYRPLSHMANALCESQKLTVDFFHRTCFDFLVMPEAQSLLHRFTDGSYNVQLYLLNARICEFLELTTEAELCWQAMNLASNLLASLGRFSFKATQESADLAAVLEKPFEALVQRYNSGESALYVSPSVCSWNHEQSTFLTLAIDFDLTCYVKRCLTPEIIKHKQGRPILDYILRCRFPAAEGSAMDIGNQGPSPEVLALALEHGAQPNEHYGSSSVWALFLCFFADIVRSRPDDDDCAEYLTALELMIRAGAAQTLPKSWLSLDTDYVYYAYKSFFQLREGKTRFDSRWSKVTPMPGQESGTDAEVYFALSDLLERFRPCFGAGVDRLRQLMR